MKSLVLKNILLVSHLEKRAKRIAFDPDISIIKGANDTGKSSLVKSIYYAFGAEPHSLHRRWLNADVATLLRFSVDGRDYSIYRHRKSFTLFDAKENVIGTYSSVTRELGPVLAEIFDFKLTLLDRNGVPITPPPAYLFLPFYIDQDKGWVDSWNSFKNLSQFSGWKNSLTSYHFGLRPDRWYELDATKRMLVTNKDAPERELAILKHLVEKTKGQLARVDFDVDIEQFKMDIKDLLVQCNKLQIKEDEYRAKQVNLRTEKIRLEAQVEIVSRTHDELSADYVFAVKAHGSKVGCPTCGAEYENSFAERFDIARDTETCMDLLQSLRDDLKAVDGKIKEANAYLSAASEQQAFINEILTKKQGEVKLTDLVKAEGKKELLQHLDLEIKAQSSILNELNQSIDHLSSEMAKFEDRDRKKGIIDRYAEILRKYSSKLSVHSLDERVYNNIAATIEESGSDQPRSILAYNFSVLDAIERNGNATFCPIVIDAPNQQEQDKSNLEKILNFIPEFRPKGRQLILALVDDCGVKFGGETIELTTKNFLLEESFYNEHSKEIRYYETRNLEIARDGD